MAQQAAMEDILSSIRTTLAEETSKVGGGSADLIDAAAAQDEDVMELSAEEMVPATNGNHAETEDLIDIAAFASSGESKTVDPASVKGAADELAAAAAAPVAAAPAAQAAPAAPAGDDAADEFDRLLAEISQEKEQNVADVEDAKKALLEEEEPLGAAEEATAVAGVAAMAEEIVSEAVADMAAPAAEGGDGPAYTLQTVQTGEGVQIALPAEVLAMALRPMVQDWLKQNLAGVVERLVKDEISKMAKA
jgi:cell pole-organizing protein PopZ